MRVLDVLVYVGAIVLICLVICALEARAEREAEKTRAFERRIREAMADADATRDTVVISRRIWHPVFGPCEQTWIEPHPARAAEQILREQA